MARLACSTSARGPCFRSFCASLPMRAIRDRAPRWQPLRAEAGSSKSSSAMNCTPSSSCPNAGSSNAPLHGSTGVEGSPGTGRISIAKRLLSCTWLQSASCCENYAIQPDVSGQTLSGFVLTLSLLRCDRPDWGLFAIRRFFRIWPPYAAAIIASFVIGHAASTSPSMPASALFIALQIKQTHLLELFKQLAMLTSHVSIDPVGWSLVHEMRLSLALPLLLIFLRRAPGATLAVCIGLNIANRNGPIWLAEWIPDTAAYVVFFAAGAWLALNRARLTERKWNSPLGNALLCVVALVMLSATATQCWSGISAGIGAILIVAVVSTSPAIANIISARWCEFLGRVSYGLYLTHVIALVTLLRLLAGSLRVVRSSC